MEITRYDRECDTMAKTDDGDFVLYEDHTKEVERLEKVINDLWDKIIEMKEKTR